MYHYDDQNFDPPAPVHKVRILSPSEPVLHIQEASVEVIALLDTGADDCCIPREIIFELERIRGYRLPYTSKLCAGFDGRSKEYKAYPLIIESDALGARRRVELIAIPDNDAIVGRNVLNGFAIMFDGPNLAWDLR